MNSFNISDYLILAPRRDIVTIPGNGIVEANVIYTSPGRRNVSKLTLRFLVRVPNFVQFAPEILNPYDYPSSEWKTYLTTVEDALKVNPKADIRKPVFDETQMDTMTREAKDEESFTFPKKYPGFHIGDEAYLRPGYANDNPSPPDLYMPATSLGYIINKHILDRIRSIQPIDVIYRKVNVRIYNALDWTHLGTRDNKYVTSAQAKGVPTSSKVVLNMDHRFKSGSNVTGKYEETDYLNQLPLGISIYPSREIQEKIIDKPSRLIINSTIFRNTLHAMSHESVQLIQHALHTPYRLAVTDYCYVEFIPIYLVQGAFRTAEVVQLEGMTRRASSYLRGDAVRTEKGDIKQTA